MRCMWVRSIKMKEPKMPPDPLLSSYATQLNCWARNERLVQRAFIFGSRVRGNYSASSDIDIAIELPFSEPNTNLAHFQFEHDRWEAELLKIIGHKVDVQFLENNGASIVRCGVSENSVVAHQKTGEA